MSFATVHIENLTSGLPTYRENLHHFYQVSSIDSWHQEEHFNLGLILCQGYHHHGNRDLEYRSQEGKFHANTPKGPSHTNTHFSLGEVSSQKSQLLFFCWKSNACKVIVWITCNLSSKLSVLLLWNIMTFEQIVSWKISELVFSICIQYCSLTQKMLLHSFVTCGLYET